jgi:hypothetical protein
MEPTSEEDFWNNQGLGREIPGGCIRRWPSRRLGLRVAHEQAETAITERILQRLCVQKKWTWYQYVWRKKLSMWFSEV